MAGGDASLWLNRGRYKKHQRGYLAGAVGRRAKVRTWPTLAEGALTPRSEAKVAAMSTGATGSR
jgi:hypothetical protein